MSDNVSYNTEEPKFPKDYKHFSGYLGSDNDILNGGAQAPMCCVMSIPIDALVLDGTAFCMFKTNSEIALHFSCLLDLFLYMLSEIKNEFDSGHDLPNVVVVLEVLRHVDKNITKPVGYRLWAFVSLSTWHPGQIIDRLIVKNQADALEEKEGNLKGGGRKKKKEYLYHSLKDMEELMKWGQILTKRPYTNAIPKIKANRLQTDNNPMRPARLFNIEYAMQGIPNIDPIQSNIDNYREGDFTRGDLKFKFPQSKCLYRLTQPQFSIDNFRLMTLPTAIEEVKREVTELSFLKSLCDATDLSKIKMDETEEDVGFDANIPLESLYDSGIAKKNGGINAPITAQTLFEENTQARLDINAHINKLKREGKKTPLQIQELHERMMNDFYNKALAKWPHVWSELGNNSSAVKNAARWLSEHTDHGKKSIYSPNRKSTTNLSYFSDFRISFRNYLEAVYKSSTAHEQTELAWYSMLNAYDPDMKNKLHLLQTGTAALSKSYVLDLIEAFSIPNTIDVFTYKTLKADAAAGDFDESCEFFHEAPYSWLGIPTGSAQAPGSSSSARTEEEAMMKDELTRGKMSLREVYFDDKGIRHSRTIIRHKNGVKFLNTNVSAHEVSEALASRLFISDFHDRRRPGSNIIDLICDTQNQAFRAFKKNVTDKFRRIHALVIMTNYLIKCGILLPVATPNSNIVFKETLKHAEERGVPKTTAPRSIARMLCMARVMTMVRAILIRFGSPLSPFKDLAGGFDVKQVITLGPNLIDDDISIPAGVIGLMQKQYYDDAQYEVIECIKNCLLPIPNIKSLMDPFEQGIHSTAEEEERATIAANNALRQASMEAEKERMQRQGTLAGNETAMNYSAIGGSSIGTTASSKGKKRRRGLTGREGGGGSGTGSVNSTTDKDASPDVLLERKVDAALSTRSNNDDLLFADLPKSSSSSDQNHNGKQDEKENADEEVELELEEEEARPRKRARKNSRPKLSAQQKHAQLLMADETEDERKTREEEEKERKKYEYKAPGGTEEGFYYFAGGIFHHDDSNYNKLSILASHLQQKMHPPRQYNEIYQRLQELMKLDVKAFSSDAAHVEKHIRAIRFHETGILIAISTCRTNKRNKLQKSLQYFLQHKYTRPTTLIFATESDERPYMFEHFHIAPTNRILELTNTNYYHPYMIQMIQSSLSMKDPYYGRLGEVFSDKKFQKIDFNMEEYYFAQHAVDCGWTAKSLEKYGIYPERVLHDKLLLNSDEEIKIWDKNYAKLTTELQQLTTEEATVRLGECPKSAEQWQMAKIEMELKWNQLSPPTMEEVEDVIGPKPDVKTETEIKKWKHDFDQLTLNLQKLDDNEIMNRIGIRPLALAPYPQCFEEEQLVSMSLADTSGLTGRLLHDAKKKHDKKESDMLLKKKTKPSDDKSQMKCSQRYMECCEILGLGDAYKPKGFDLAQKQKQEKLEKQLQQQLKTKGKRKRNIDTDHQDEDEKRHENNERRNGHDDDDDDDAKLSKRLKIRAIDSDKPGDDGGLDDNDINASIEMEREENQREHEQESKNKQSTEAMLIDLSSNETDSYI